MIAEVNGFPTTFDSLEDKWDMLSQFTKELLSIADKLGVTDLELVVNREAKH